MYVNMLHLSKELSLEVMRALSLNLCIWDDSICFNYFAHARPTNFASYFNSLIISTYVTFDTSLSAACFPMQFRSDGRAGKELGDSE